MDLLPYVELLEQFIKLAAEWDKPIVLHAVYEDADIACALLEKYSVSKAHFHWFKGARKTVERMAGNGYFISFTPDIVYEAEIQELATLYPADQVMAETDGPWPFEGPFAGQTTHPRMIEAVARKYGELAGLTEQAAIAQLLYNTRQFYR